MTPKRNKPLKSSTPRWRHLADEYDEVYQQVEWMMMGCPASPGDQFTELGGVSRPRTVGPAKTKEDFFPGVPLPRDYADHIRARDVGSVEVVVGPVRKASPTGEVGEDVEMTVTFAGPVDITQARASFEAGLAQVADRLGRVGKPKNSARPAEAAYLLWLVRGAEPPLGREEAARHWNALRAQWSALQAGDSTEEALLIALPSGPAAGAPSAKKFKAIKTPLEDHPEAYYAYLEWLAEHQPGEPDTYDGRRVSQLIARLRPNFSQHARSGEDT